MLHGSFIFQTPSLLSNPVNKKWNVVNDFARQVVVVSFLALKDGDQRSIEGF
jgi:hypothetical protein